MNERSDIDRYPFSIRKLSSDDGGGFLIEYPDLPGCHSDGETPEEAVANGRDAVRSYLASCQKHGDPIPEPSSDEGYSGQLRVRMSKRLHAKLAAAAKREGISLNAFIVEAAAEAVGMRQSAKRKRNAA